MFLAITLLAILLAFTQAEGCGRPITSVESISFSPDGSKLCVTKFTMRDANERVRLYVRNLTRTITVLDHVDGAVWSVVDQQTLAGVQGPHFIMFHLGDRSADFFDNETIIYHDLHEAARAADVWLHSLNDGERKEFPLAWHQASNLAISPSRTWIVAGERQMFSVLDHSGKERFTRRRDSPGRRELLCCFNGSESRLATATRQSIEIWDPATGSHDGDLLPSLSPDYNALAFLPDDTLVVATARGLHRYSLAGATLTTYSSDVFLNLDISSDGSRLAAVTADRELELYDAETGAALPATGLRAECVAISPDGKTLAVGVDGAVTLVDAATSTELWTVNPPGRQGFPWTGPALMLAGWSAFVWWSRRKRAKGALDETTLAHSSEPGA